MDFGLSQEIQRSAALESRVATLEKALSEMNELAIGYACTRCGEGRYPHWDGNRVHKDCVCGHKMGK